jgi:catechol 2,3-dioxygenase-like lactoylglutathione lyase family enzyme
VADAVPRAGTRGAETRSPDEQRAGAGAHPWLLESRPNPWPAADHGSYPLPRRALSLASQPRALPANDAEPLTEDPDTNVPQSSKPHANGPQTNGPRPDESHADQALSNEPPTYEPQTNEPQTHERHTNEPHTNGPHTNESHADQALSDEPRTDEPQTNELQTNELPVGGLPVNRGIDAAPGQAQPGSDTKAVGWAAGRRGRDPGLQLKPMVHVANMGESIRFYELLGAEIVHGDRDSDWVLLQLGTTQIGLLAQPPEADQGQGAVELNFAAAMPLDELEDRLRRDGVSIADMAAHRDFGVQLHIRTPDGLLIRISQLEPDLYT